MYTPIDFNPYCSTPADCSTPALRRQRWRGYLVECAPEKFPHDDFAPLPPFPPLHRFHLMLMHHIFFPDHAKAHLAHIQAVVQAVLGLDCFSAPELDFNSVLRVASPVAPCVFVLSPGNNPLPKLVRFAQSHSKVVVSISLGRGRGPKAQELFDKYRAQSRWLCLENCHLAGTWMPQVRTNTVRSIRMLNRLIHHPRPTRICFVSYVLSHSALGSISYR